MIDNNKIKIGIAISTYSEEKTQIKRYNIIEKSLKSLENILKNTKLNVYVIIIVDGNVPKIHNEILNKFNFSIYRRPNNGGVARTKNSSIRLLLEQNIDIGFLADDDVEYKTGCIEKYAEAIQKSKLPHLGFCQVNPIVRPKNLWKKHGYVKFNINGIELMKHSGRSVGCWLSFTPELIKKIGYFKVMPGKYGYEHVNFTYRCIHSKIIPHACDIVNPLNYIDHIGFEAVGLNEWNKNHSISEEIRVKENKKNEKLWKIDLDKYINNIE